LKVPPRSNCAAVVFREPDILNFTKYVNHLSNSQFYYVLSCSFFGVASDEGSEDSLESGGEEEHEEMNSDTDEDFVS
jgi:hypothetical protein